MKISGHDSKFLLSVLLMLFIISCGFIEEKNQDPEIEPLKHGFKTSAAAGYCSSLAMSLFRGEDLPENVLFQSGDGGGYSGGGILFVTINENYPLPFNSSVGQISIACLWSSDYDMNEYSGVITIAFTDIDIINSKYEFGGIRTIPVIQDDDGNVLCAFAEQDVAIGEGSDTLINVSMSNPEFNSELERTASPRPADAFAAAKQNVWFVKVDRNGTSDDLYDDKVTVNGGGQIAEVEGASGGILYHAMIDAAFTYDDCNQNPTTGVGFIQNLKAGTDIDLGHIFLNFHDKCDGKAYVKVGTGKYLTSTQSNVNLHFN